MNVPLPILRALSSLSILFLWVLAGCGSDESGPVALSDSTSPGAVADLSASAMGDTAIILRWTAPGDDEASGTASVYDIRYSTTLLQSASWSRAALIEDEPAPQAAGQSEQFTVPILRPDQTYYFALKTIDEMGNESSLSSVAMLDRDAPEAIGDLEALASSSSRVSLSWSAPDDNDLTGRAHRYSIHYAKTWITEEVWERATAVPDPPLPQISGSRETCSISDLEPETDYYFAVKSSDVAGNTSALSNVVTVHTPESSQGWREDFASAGLEGWCSVLFSHNGGLIAGGQLTRAGQTPVEAIARWADGSWSGLGGGLRGGLGTPGVLGLCEYEGDLVAVGQFAYAGATPAHSIARWSGASWLAFGGGADGVLKAAASYNGDLYVGGVFYTVDGQDMNAVARWDGSSWHSLGFSYLYALGVSDLIVYDGVLIAAGSFTRVGATLVHNIAGWDGSVWRTLGSGLRNSEDFTVVSALEIYEGDLVAAGNFTLSGPAPVRGVARWDGSSWSQLGEDPPEGVWNLTLYNNDLIAVGELVSHGEEVFHGIARWDGMKWKGMNGGLTGEHPFTRASALAVHEGSLYVGGEFDHAGGTASANIARWNDD